MNSIKVLFGVIFLVFCYITFGDSLKCFHCTSKSACNNATLVSCNQTLADNTGIYLSQHYQNVSLTSTGRFQCLRDELTTSSGEFHYRSCVDASINSCNLTVRNPGSSWNRDCWQCDSYDGCNPAMRAEVSYLAIILSVVVAYFFKK